MGAFVFAIGVGLVLLWWLFGDGFKKAASDMREEAEMRKDILSSQAKPVAPFTHEEFEHAKNTGWGHPSLVPRTNIADKKGRRVWYIHRDYAHTQHGIDEYVLRTKEFKEEWARLRRLRHAALVSQSNYQMDVKSADNGIEPMLNAYGEVKYSPEHFPKRIVLKNSAPKNLPEWFTSIWTAPLMSDRVAELFDKFEPGRFQWFPMEFVSVEGKPLATYRFYVDSHSGRKENGKNICDGHFLKLEECGFEKKVYESGSFSWSPKDPVRDLPLILDNSKIKSKHYFVEADLYNKYLSDEFKSEVEQFFPKSHKLVEAVAI